MNKGEYSNNIIKEINIIYHEGEKRSLFINQTLFGI